MASLTGKEDIIGLELEPKHNRIVLIGREIAKLLARLDLLLASYHPGGPSHIFAGKSISYQRHL